MAITVILAKAVLTPATPLAISVGITPTAVLSENKSRTGCYLTNTSSNYISLGFGVKAVLYSGITLNPGGGAYWMEENKVSTAAINAIASGAASSLGVQEFT